MKIKRNQLLMILLTTGFLIGIIYTSRVKIDSIVFHEGVLSGFEKYEWEAIVRERVGTLLLVIFLGQVRWKHIYGSLLTTIIGISLGSLLVTSVCEMKIRGLWFLVTAMFPHMCFYGLAYTILICYWLGDKKARWSWNKTIGVVLFMGAGIACEVYVNPILVKLFWK